MHSAMLEMLESRKLMSLVIDLRAAGGGKDVNVTEVGQVIQLEAWGVVTGNNDIITDEALQSAMGSFLSSAGGAVLGNLSATRAAPFNALGSTDGLIQDLDGDGDLDVGSDGTVASAYFNARASTPQPGSDPSPDGAGAQFKIADLTFTVTEILDTSGTTEVNFRPRPGALRAVWREDNAPYHSGMNTFAAGAPVVLTVGQPPTATIGGSVFIDQNGNGKMQKHDTAAVGWVVFDDLDDDGILDTNEASALTDADGNFILTVAPGTHTIRVVPQDDYDPSRHLATSYTVTVAADEEAGGLLFGQEPV